MVDGVDVDVVDVQMQTTVGLIQDGANELQLRHGALRRVAAGGRVGGHILHADAPFQDVLHPADSIRHVMHGLLGVGDGHEVIELTAIPAIGQMFGVNTDPMGIQKTL